MKRATSSSVPARTRSHPSIPHVPRSRTRRPLAARRDEGTLRPHLLVLALETSDGTRDVVDGRDLLEHLGRNADTEASLDVGNEFHDAQTVQPEIVLNVVRRTNFSALVHMTAQQIADSEHIPLGTAKTRIRDGMQKLRAAYLPEEAGNE